jgi:integrase/recombinase XerD
MSMRSYSISAFVRLDRKKGNTAPLYIRVRMNSKKMEYSIGIEIPLESWDPISQKIINHKKAKLLNSHLESEISNVRKSLIELINLNQPFEIASLKTSITSKSEKTPETTLGYLIQMHNQNFKSLIGVRYSQGSYKNYKTTERFLKEFIKSFYKKVDIPLVAINNRFVDLYIQWLISEKGTNNNGCVKWKFRLNRPHFSAPN